MKKVRYLIVSVSSAVLAFLSNLEPNQNKQWLMKLNDYKVEISILRPQKGCRFVAKYIWMPLSIQNQ